MATQIFNRDGFLNLNDGALANRANSLASDLEDIGICE